MIQDNLYLFEVHINKCTILVQPEGQISLFLRIGKTTSSFLRPKSFDGKVILFDSAIRCNCNRGALDTNRFSLTLNMKTSNKQSKVLGIVMISLENEPSEKFQVFKIAQCSDPQATIQLKYSVNMIIGNSDINKKGSVLSSSFTPKKSEDNKKTNAELKIASVKGPQKKKEKGHFLDAFLTTPLISRSHTSQFFQDVQTLQKQEFNSQYEEITRLKESNSQLLQQNLKLKSEKLFLKELLKVETSKNHILSDFMEKIYTIFVERRINDVLSGKKIEKQSKEELPSKEKQIQELTNKLYTSVSSIGQSSKITPLTQNEQKSRFETTRNDNNFSSDSKISFSKISGINDDLKNMLKDSIAKEREESKNAIQQLRKALMDESELKHERRLRSVKIKVEKSYLQLFKQPQPYTKENIMKQKINVNKILDELVMCKITP